MNKNFIIGMVELLFKALHRALNDLSVGWRKGRFARIRVASRNLDFEYREMAMDKDREKQALAWTEAMVADIDSRQR